MSTNQRILGGFGAVYVLVGVLGFIPGITVPSTQPGQGLLLGIFAVNTLHNITHLLLGAIMLWAGMSGDRVVTVARAMAAIFAVLFVVSLIAPNLEQVPQNLPDTLLHAASALLTGYIGFMASRRASATA